MTTHNSSSALSRPATRLRRLLTVGVAVFAASALTGCSVSGGGKICSVDEDVSAGTTFSVNFLIDNETETIDGTANVHDHGAAVNAKISLSEQDFSDCVLLIDVDAVQDFLTESLFGCLEIDENDVGPDDVALLFGRYRLRGPGKKAAIQDGYAAEGCFVGVYLDLGQPGTEGDGAAFALLDDSDPVELFYSNCGVIKGGNITVELQE